MHNNYEIRWKNFRGFKDTNWVVLRPLTILIGPNNTGKTSLVAPILLMAQTMASRDAATALLTRGPIIDLGSFNEVIHMHNRKNELFLGLRFHVHDPKEWPEKVNEVGAYAPGAFESTITATDDSIVLAKFELFDIFKRSYLTQTRTNADRFKLRGKSITDLTRRERLAITKSKPVNFLFSPAAALYQARKGNEDNSEASKHSDDFNHYLSLMATTFESVRRIFLDLSYVGPMRRRLRRYYYKNSNVPEFVGREGEHMANLARRASAAAEMNKWVSKFEFGKKLVIDNVNQDLFSLVFEDAAGNRTNVADAGFGASQVLPLIVQAVVAQERSLTIAEQPEIHLNPRLQSVLADLFVAMAKAERRVVVETHSEHLLLRLRSLIASGEIKSENVAVYFVERTAAGSTVRPIPIDDAGHISTNDWPTEFFGDGLKESLALSEAQSKRRRKETH